MTAIFAFAAGDVAFIAADTLRGVPGGLLPVSCVTKVHHWSDRVVFGQAGTSGGMTPLIAELKAKKTTFVGEDRQVYYDDSEAWLYKAFEKIRPSFHSDIEKKVGAKLANGTLTVAHAENGSGKLVQYDFATGTKTPLQGPVTADGTNAEAFIQIAQEELATRTKVASNPIELDAWAQACVAQAVHLHPNAVGWPCDMLISRSNRLGGRMLVYRRIDANSKPGDPLFAV